VSAGRSQAGADPAAEAAIAWFVRLHDDPADLSLRAEFEAWRDADPRHARAYERLQRLWGASAHLPSLAVQKPTMDRRRMLRGAVGAGGAAAVALVGGRLALGPHPFADYATRPGETARVALADGSLVELSTATAVNVDFNARRRRLRLLGGEAWFRPAATDARPFIVEAAGGWIEAGEVAFAAAIETDGARVGVTAKAVRVGMGQAVATLREGYGLSYGRAGLEPPRPLSEDSMAWRDGRLVFVNAPLGRVAAVLDRWTGGRTLILDDDLAARPVTLLTRTTEAARGLERLAQATPMRIRRGGSLLAVVTPI